MFSVVSATCLSVWSSAISADAQPTGGTGPELQTNQAWIEGMQKASSLEIKSAMDGFRFVFSKLPPKLFVYPTENYYYYTFTHEGVVYAGNLRLAAQDRDQGILHFAMFKQANQASAAGPMNYKALSKGDGVDVKKIDTFEYEVQFNGKRVVFQLNDVSSRVPPADIVAEGEEYLGLVFDESGIRFFLFYNAKQKVFAYVLDETAPVLDDFKPIEDGSRIVTGHRTGFAFYKHHHLKRKVLIGVHGANTVVNNYYDGPADQLPENHIKDDNLRKSIVDANPQMKGQLDSFGYLKSGEGRYLIVPYIQYLSLDELVPYDTCAKTPGLSKDRYNGCFYSSDN